MRRSICALLGLASLFGAFVSLDASGLMRGAFGLQQIVNTVAGLTAAILFGLIARAKQSRLELWARLCGAIVCLIGLLVLGASVATVHAPRYAGAIIPLILLTAVPMVWGMLTALDHDDSSTYHIYLPLGVGIAATAALGLQVVSIAFSHGAGVTRHLSELLPTFVVAAVALRASLRPLPFTERLGRWTIGYLMLAGAMEIFRGYTSDPYLAGLSFIIYIPVFLVGIILLWLSWKIFSASNWPPLTRLADRMRR